MGINNVVGQTAQISTGTIEYSLDGNGPTILITHGTLGGYDQALAISQLFNRELFSFLCVSRAGYLQSDPATGYSAEDQARSYRELLDHLGIASVAVIGLSGGAPSALRFAQDFPDRCRALVLLSSISQTPQMPPFFKVIIRLQDVLMGIEPLWKLTYKYGLRRLVLSNGVTAEQATQILQDPALQKVVRGIYKPITSSRSRRKGLQIDDAQIQSLPPIDSYHIRVPVYIGHAANDPLAPAEDAANLVEIIPDVEYHAFPDGGHLFFVVHSNTLAPDIERFLQAHAIKSDGY